MPFRLRTDNDSPGVEAVAPTALNNTAGGGARRCGIRWSAGRRVGI